ncbi:MAG TPA: 4-hydroxythreonine-4-phosphate dehydrogenase PdxA, partial [bacterium]|nr:4-hydroxythreonine-4-phosphate dehydrogenase PdxA [bacterium]
RAGLLVSAYHDQILPLFKARYFHSGVNVTIGLPLIRTSPDHGTAFNLAHRNLASSASMQAAIRLALKLACRA